MLEFEHIVQVNDLSNKGIIALTRNQLWQGLVLRARSPEKFNHALQCESQAPENNEFIRTIEAGSSSFRERVILYPEQKICTKTIAEFDQIAAQSTTTIEEPEQGSLFVRFYYKRELDITDERVDVGEHLKSAYVQLDRDAIAMIRLLAESALFDQTIN
ncbi:MAG: DUF1857 family protein [Gammaproteobacteria bacterium]|nr:DUF1857 family protein [Gammaproteobacteria bacterium]MDD9895237.1 DUF1857 family protein [Gammaproteobacteria bacterium]MDD9958881.1 DUF1857 family protein [Gammaproteobacteria bacterium]